MRVKEFSFAYPVIFDLYNKDPKICFDFLFKKSKILHVYEAPHEASIRVRVENPLFFDIPEDSSTITIPIVPINTKEDLKLLENL